jgi:hypothetical protein
MRFIDESELQRRAMRRARQRRLDTLWNVLTSLVVLSTLGLIGYFLLLFADPQGALNPFPPPTMPVLAVLPDGTSAAPLLTPTWKSTVLPTKTPLPTATSKPTVKAGSPTATFAQAPTFALSDGGDFPYAIQGEPAAMANTVFHAGDTCDWQGVAGTVVDLQGKPVVGVLVRLLGYYNGRAVDMTTLTGGASAWYGESGYEFVLGDKPLDTNNTLALQLVDQAMMPILNRVILDTFADCARNLVLVNFKQAR